jgi:hypothetical protein
LEARSGVNVRLRHEAKLSYRGIAQSLNIGG